MTPVRCGVGVTGAGGGAGAETSESPKVMVTVDRASDPSERMKYAFEPYTPVDRDVFREYVTRSMVDVRQIRKR